MKQFYIQDFDFVKIMNAVGRSASTDDVYPNLKFIQFNVRENVATFYACDGGLISKFRINVIDTEDFDGFLPVLNLKIGDDFYGEVSIRQKDENRTLVSFGTDFGVVEYTCEPPEKVINLENIFNTHKKEPKIKIEIGLNAKRCIRAFEALAEVGGSLVLEIVCDEICPIIMRSVGERDISFEQMVLPERIRNE